MCITCIVITYLISEPVYPFSESSEPPKVIDGEMAWAKVKSLQKYLDDALADRENLAAEYKKHPNDRSYGKILENNRLIEQLHVSNEDLIPLLIKMIAFPLMCAHVRLFIFASLYLLPNSISRA